MRIRQLPICLAVICAALITGTTTGCSIIRGDEPEPILGVEQAVRRVDSTLDDTFEAVHPRLQWRQGPAHLTERKNSLTNKSTGEVGVSRQRYVRTKVSTAKLVKLIETVRHHWIKEGFEVHVVDPRTPTLSGKAPDGRGVNITVSAFGDVEISAGIGARSDQRSGDIPGEGGDAFPKARDGGPDYTPDRRDPYWSA
ncbi:hypothetical protein [Streptomyces sp. NRRL F-4489]|uniref:hypothetical protein n=1 Tax=Streptomyces sp. NRRL F-4489 TaxID=1609095 RepID=UPI00131AD2CF|nr:hypothetical protein [Streptomyces sp. NRRL F-4489]